ncbi:MAG: hypothetical protein WA478_23005, partial [Pseudolabrys sp.]
HRTRRELGTPRNVIEVSTINDVRGQVQLVAGITQGKALIERGVAKSHFAVNVDIGTEQVADPPVVARRASVRSLGSSCWRLRLPELLVAIHVLGFIRCSIC